VPNPTTATRTAWNSLQDIADRTGFSEETLRRRISDGSLKAYRVGPRSIRIREDDFLAFIESQTIGNAGSV
jgi:excisionase family DNA binding protein